MIIKLDPKGDMVWSKYPNNHSSPCAFIVPERWNLGIFAEGYCAVMPLEDWIRLAFPKAFKPTLMEKFITMSAGIYEVIVGEYSWIGVRVLWYRVFGYRRLVPGPKRKWRRREGNHDYDTQG